MIFTIKVTCPKCGKEYYVPSDILTPPQRKPKFFPELCNACKREKYQNIWDKLMQKI